MLRVYYLCKSASFMSTPGTIFICAAVPAILRWLYTKAAAGKATLTDDSITFPESRVVPVIRWCSLILFSAAAGASWVYGRSLIATSIFGGFALFALFFAHGDPIVINNSGISGASMWGRRASLAWTDVASIQCNTGQHTITVIGKSGSKVCHSGFHLDPSRFEQEVKRRTGLPMKVIQPGTWKAKVFYR
jgi:hypothetical protein